MLYRDIPEKDRKLWNIGQEIVEGMGYAIVELRSAVVRRNTIISLILYSPDGVTADACAQIHRLVQARIEAQALIRNISMSVSSPGVTRTFKYLHEFHLFRRCLVRILIDDEWHVGTIIDANMEWVMLAPFGDAADPISYSDSASDAESKSETGQRIPLKSVQKAKLMDPSAPHGIPSRGTQSAKNVSESKR